MDPLSITAAVVGLVSGAGNITATLYEITNSIKDAPSLARHVMSEVHSINSIICSLQTFLWGESRASKSREAMILIEHLVTTLTGCVCTFSELEVEVNGLKTSDGMNTLDRVRWAFREDTVNELFQRLQNHKSSLSLMLTILECKSNAQAEKSLEKLCVLVAQLLQSQKDMSERLKRLEVVPVESLLAKDSDIRSLRSFRPGSSSSASIRSTSGTFAFDNILHVTRVYKRALSNRPTSDVPLSGASQYTEKSYFSGISLAEISHISVLSLPVYSFEISNSQNYAFGTIIEEEDAMSVRHWSNPDSTWKDQPAVTARPLSPGAVIQTLPPKPFFRGLRPKSRLRLWRRSSSIQSLSTVEDIEPEEATQVGTGNSKTDNMFNPLIGTAEIPTVVNPTDWDSQRPINGLKTILRVEAGEMVDTSNKGPSWAAAVKTIRRNRPWPGGVIDVPQNSVNWETAVAAAAEKARMDALASQLLAAEDMKRVYLESEPWSGASPITMEYYGVSSPLRQHPRSPQLETMGGSLVPRGNNSSTATEDKEDGKFDIWTTVVAQTIEQNKGKIDMSSTLPTPSIEYERRVGEEINSSYTTPVAVVVNNKYPEVEDGSGEAPTLAAAHENADERAPPPNTAPLPVTTAEIEVEIAEKTVETLHTVPVPTVVKGVDEGIMDASGETQDSVTATKENWKDVLADLPPVIEDEWADTLNMALAWAAAKAKDNVAGEDVGRTENGLIEPTPITDASGGEITKFSVGTTTPKCLVDALVNVSFQQSKRDNTYDLGPRSTESPQSLHPARSLSTVH